jgi:hypothetical protein
LAVLADTRAKLAIEVASFQENGSTAASVTVERLLQGKAVSAQAAETVKPVASAAVDLGDFQVRGHIAGTGDVLVGANEWVAGPSAPSRIEGIAIDWPGKPDGLGIRYSVKLAKPQPMSGKMMDLGSFAGTRGRALAIVGIVLEMAANGSSGCQFTVEALFLGSPIARVRGSRVVLAGPTGREPLVGFRVGVEASGAAALAAAKPALPRTHARASGQVRVFRSTAS